MFPCNACNSQCFYYAYIHATSKADVLSLLILMERSVYLSAILKYTIFQIYNFLKFPFVAVADGRICRKDMLKILLWNLYVAGIWYMETKA